MLLQACLPKPDDTTAYSRDAMPCRIWLDSVVRNKRIKKEYGSEKGRRGGTRSACDRGGLHSSKSERICTLAYQSVTSEVVQVWQILFTRSCLPARTFPATTASSSQLLNYELSTRSQSRVLAVKLKSRRKVWRGGGGGDGGCASQIFVLTLQGDIVGHASREEWLTLSIIMVTWLLRGWMAM